MTFAFERFVDRCPSCGGRIDRPGLFQCDRKPHPAPNLAEQIWAVVEHQLNDRRGFHVSSLDDDTADEMRDSITNDIAKVILKWTGIKPTPEASDERDAGC